MIYPFKLSNPLLFALYLFKFITVILKGLAIKWFMMFLVHLPILGLRVMMFSIIYISANINAREENIRMPKDL